MCRVARKTIKNRKKKYAELICKFIKNLKFIYIYTYKKQIAKKRARERERERDIDG